jgi:hypothetical protein
MNGKKATLNFCKKDCSELRDDVEDANLLVGDSIYGTGITILRILNEELRRGSLHKAQPQMCSGYGESYL